MRLVGSEVYGTADGTDVISAGISTFGTAELPAAPSCRAAARRRLGAASAIATAIDSGGFQMVSSGATTYGTVVNFGGVQNDNGARRTTRWSRASEASGFTPVRPTTPLLNGGFRVDYGTAIDTAVNGYFGDAFRLWRCQRRDGRERQLFVRGERRHLTGISTAAAPCSFVYAGGMDDFTRLSDGEQHVFGLASFATSVIESGGAQLVSSGGRDGNA